MTKFLSKSYDALEETPTHVNSLKPKMYPGENVTDWWYAILVDSGRLEGYGVFQHEHLEYTTHVFEDTRDSRFRLWVIHKYKDFMEFIKKLHVCDMDAISPE